MAEEPKKYTQGKRNVNCSHCGQYRFFRVRSNLDLTHTDTFTQGGQRVDNPEITIYICDNCGHIESFARTYNE